MEISCRLSVSLDSCSVRQQYLFCQTAVFALSGSSIYNEID